MRENWKGMSLNNSEHVGSPISEITVHCDLSEKRAHSKQNLTLPTVTSYQDGALLSPMSDPTVARPTLVLGVKRTSLFDLPMGVK